MNILIIEDNADDLKLVENFLLGLDYTVHSASNNREILEKFEFFTFDIIVSNRLILEMGDIERFQNEDSKKYHYFIYMVKHDSREEYTINIGSEADDYIVKPIKIKELEKQIKIGARIVNLEKERKRRSEENKRNTYQTLSMFTSLIEIYDEDLGGHCRRTAQLSLALAKRHPNVSEDDYRIIEGCGLLHDIGMIGLPNAVLSKKRTERNNDERKHYLSHPVRGEIILHEIEFLQPIAKIVRSHHEQINGLGFPDGLKGEEIPLWARIVSAASVYDNFVNRGKVPLEEIPINLQTMKGVQLDPFIVDLVLKLNMENIIEEEGKDFQMLALNDLAEGMVLARDIRMKTGALAMPCDMKLTRYSIEKLNSFNKLECITDMVYVYKS